MPLVAVFIAASQLDDIFGSGAHWLRVARAVLALVVLLAALYTLRYPRVRVVADELRIERRGKRTMTAQASSVRSMRATANREPIEFLDEAGMVVLAAAFGDGLDWGVFRKVARRLGVPFRTYLDPA